ncbi:hypothetical protein [Tautonia sociabilis]|uniref:Uncharacterized protein n=1 Tax=Tautonia sociabilis TaxID=2080755 RepID=A0A432MDV0_9BACT|nr:hypothetical protein [Tautonia sociabilis]RUL83174.1 hypothetical protein TsocGM_22520 [Tautonia sociabilis]
MKPPFATKRFLCSIALMLGALAWLMILPKARTAHHDSDLLVRKTVITSEGPAAIFIPGTSAGASSLDAHLPHMIEEDEEESFDDFPHYVSLAFLLPEIPIKVVSGPIPGNSPRIAAVPLRC